jgi:putative spermidine/putrescine transport system permease protein
VAHVTAVPGPHITPAITGTSQRSRRPGGRLVWWIVFAVGALYFLLPLVATLEFSLRRRPFLSAYTESFADPRFGASLIYSFAVGVLTIVLSIALILPTAYWVRLKVPRLRPVVEFITLLPFVIPAIVLVFGLIRVYSRPPVPFTHTDLGSTALLVAGYVVLSLPYMYRAVDTGLRAVDIRSLTEAAQSLGAGWPTIVVRVILPNVRVALVSGAFLTLAIVMGEFTIALYLARGTFGVYLSELGTFAIFEPAAVALVSFGLTWLAMGVIALVGRRGRGRITVVATH